MDNEVREPWRFWSKVERRESGCWEWTGSVTVNGYGYGWNFAAALGGGQRTYAHRQSWMMANGREIPPGMQIDHLCRNRVCVNPEHLEVVTQRENLLRGATMAAHNAGKTECPQGHPYDAENTRRLASGGRVCRACNRAAQARWRARVGAV